MGRARIFARVTLCHCARTCSTLDASPKLATTTAKVAPPASQLSIFSVVATPPSGTVFSVESGLQGNINLREVCSGRTSRQLNVGLHALSADTDTSPASKTCKSPEEKQRVGMRWQGVVHDTLQGFMRRHGLKEGRSSNRFSKSAPFGRKAYPLPCTNMGTIFVPSARLTLHLSVEAPRNYPNKEPSANVARPLQGVTKFNRKVRAMSDYFSPYDVNRPLMLKCSCGKDHTVAEHRAADIHAAVSADTAAVELRRRSQTSEFEAYSNAFIEATLVKAIFPQDDVRRRFLKAVGKSTAMAAIASVLPVASMQAMAQDAGKKPGSLEKNSLKIGFIPITCATPLIMAAPLGFYQQQGLSVEVTKTAGWALIRDKMINKEYDATHFLSPMPLAISMGLGSNATPMNVATIQNINGQAITMALKHKDNRDPKNWKGFKFAIPFEYSMHNFLLRYYLAEAGLNPDTDVQLRVVPPAEMVANLRAGNIDGFLGPDPFNQRAVYEEVGFIHVLTKDLWNGHPCCAFGTSTEFIQKNPNTFAALYRSVLTAAAMARDPKNRELIAKVIAPAQYLNQPEAVLNQVLTGKFADGLGNIKTVPDRADFDPMPWQSMAVWMLTQMKRWGYVKGEVNYKQIAEKVFLITDAKKHMKDLGQKTPDGAYPKFTIMGKEFDAAKADSYAKGFAINKMG